MSEIKNIIEIKNLNKIYNEGKSNEFVALKDINLNIKESEIVILKGVSGSGKSTLLSLLGALAHPTSGDIIVDTQSIAKLPDNHASKYRNIKIGFIFQSFNLIDELSVNDNVIAPLVISNIKDTQSKVNEALNLANISHKKDEKVINLSGGEKQRTAIARALVTKPDIILADEPTANLDKDNSLKFIEILKEFKKLRKTVVVATHDSLFDGLDFVDRYVDIVDGVI